MGMVKAFSIFPYCKPELQPFTMRKSYVAIGKPGTHNTSLNLEGLITPSIKRNGKRPQRQVFFIRTLGKPCSQQAWCA